MKALTLFALTLLALGACTSNPTPHPGQDAARNDDAYVGATDPDASPPDYGPDDDNDGVADCVEVNGMWDGETCNVAAPTVDAGDAADGGDGGEDAGHDADDAMGDR